MIFSLMGAQLLFIRKKRMSNILLAIFLKRPALKLAVLTILGLLIGYYVDVSPVVLFLTLITLSIAAVILVCVNNSWSNYFLIVTFALAGLLNYEMATRIFPSHHIVNFIDSNESVAITGTVVGFPIQKKDHLEIELNVSKIFSSSIEQNTRGKILVKLWLQNFSLDFGEQIQIRGRLIAPRGERNPGDFDYQKFLAAQKIYGAMNVATPEKITILPSAPPKSITYMMYRIKQKFNQAIEQLYQGKARAIIQALLLGERGEIDPELKQAFIDCGVIHALAISGLHVGYIIFIFFALFSLLRFSYEARIIAVLKCLIFYNLLIGFAPPIVRASLMAGIFLLGRLWQRPTDMLNVISAAALIILLVSPLQLFQASFQLSFMAVISIVFLYQRLKFFFDRSSLFRKLSKSNIGNFLGKLFLVTFAAQLGTLPLVAYYFHRISIISFLMNLLVIPLLGVIIALGLLSLFSSLISISLAQFYANSNTIILDSLIRVLEQSSQFKFSAIEISPFGLVSILLYYLLLLIVVNLDKKFCQKALVFSASCIFLFLAWKPIVENEKWMQVIFFDVGQGDAAFVTFPDGKNLLIDAGPAYEKFDAGQAFIIPYLKREKIRQIDTVILTHSDVDHIGGMASIFQKIQVNKIYDNGIYQASPGCSTYNQIIDRLGISHEKIYAGERLPASNEAGIFILHPNRSFVEKNDLNLNNGSIVLKINYGKISFLFAGDIEVESENLLLAYGELLRANVLKVAHHGSRTSSSGPMLQRIQPQYAVISVGKNNQFNLPDPDVMKRFQALGIETIRTDRNGAAIFRTDGVRLERIR